MWESGLKHIYVLSGASDSVSWDLWESARSKQKSLGSEICRESLADVKCCLVQGEVRELVMEVTLIPLTHGQILHLSWELLPPVELDAGW